MINVDFYLLIEESFVQSKVSMFDSCSIEHLFNQRSTHVTVALEDLEVHKSLKQVVVSLFLCDAHSPALAGQIAYRRETIMLSPVCLSKWIDSMTSC
jgi:hypothetical protein